MVDKKIKSLAAAKARVAKLEQAIAAELKHELAGLPAEFGFENVDSFVDAVLAATGGKGRGGPGAKVGQKSGGRKPRAVITDATRAEVKKLVKDGKTGTEIAKALKISLPSVQNIKKALGLVKKKK